MKAKTRTRCTRIGMIVGVLFVVYAGTLFLPGNSLEAKDTVEFLLDWTIYGIHPPLFLALERGYYDAEGIDVTFTESAGSQQAIMLVGEGKKYPIGYGDYGTMVKIVDQGVPVKAVFGVMQNSPMAIISHADSPIRTPKELEGKIIAMFPGESTALLFPALMAAAGVDIKKITILNPAVGAKNALMLQRRTDAITGYMMLQTAQLEAQGANVYYFRWADFGVNTLANGLVVNARFLSKNKDLVKRFLRATAKGWSDAKNDPEAAVEAVFKTRPEQSSQKKVLLRELQLTIPLLETPNTKGKPLGWMSEKDWEQTQEILAKYGGLKKKIPVENYFTNECIPK